jgi:hypothetical protein
VLIMNKMKQKEREQKVRHGNEKKRKERLV